MRRRVLRLAAAAALTLSLAACGSSGAANPSPSQLQGNAGGGTFDGVGLRPPQPRPSFTLTTDTGKPFAFGTDTAGHPTLLYFGYTNCPDVCPATMADVSRALSTVPADVAAKTYVVFVTTDVKRDTAAVIGQWLGNFDTGSKATWVGLRGTQAQVDAAQAAAHIPLAEDGGQTHSAQLLLYGPDDYAHVSYLESDTGPSGSIAHDLPLVARGVTG